jgi:1-acyl-sn-glycerol-3-phosphate acyltransferase
MSDKGQFALLRERRFLPFFLTQALGAFNDNLFKNGLIVLVTYLSALTVAQQNAYTNLAAALFILPFFLFSATAGQLAEKYDKSRLSRAIKLLELVIMAVAAAGFMTRSIPVLLAALFLMGLHSTLFGPLKYSILPQVLRETELVGGNGLVEMGTFVAILGGTLLAGILINVPGQGPMLVAGATIGVALAGLVTAFAMPRVPATAPDLRIDWNVFAETWRNLKYLKSNRTVFLSCLGISWFWFFGSMYFTQLPLYARNVLGGDPSVFTLLLTVFSVGVAIGSLLCEKLSGHKVEIGLVPFGSIGMTLFGVDLYFAWPESTTATALAWRAFATQPGAWRVLLDLAGMAVFSGFFIVPLFALIQTRTEASHRSRVIAANNILNALFMVAAAVIGVVLLNVCHFSIPQLLLVTALLNAAVAIYIYTLVPEFLLRFLSWLVVNTLYRLQVKGLENVPDEGAALIVCNHVSFMDPLIVAGTVRRPIRFVMYYKIFQWWGLSWLFRAARAIPIAGRKEDPEMMERAFAEVDRELAAGNLIAIFPEGGITRDGAIQRFRPGVERILEARPVPVIPMALRGMWGSLFSRRDRLRIPRRFWSRIELVVAEPVPPEQAEAEVLEAKVKEMRGDQA